MTGMLARLGSVFHIWLTACSMILTGSEFHLLALTPQTMSFQLNARMISPNRVDSDSAWGDISLLICMGVLGENGGIGHHDGGVRVAGSCRGIFRGSMVGGEENRVMFKRG